MNGGEFGVGELITRREAAARLKVSVSTVANYARRGVLQARRIRGSRLIRFDARDVEALCEPLPPREAAGQERGA